VFFVSTDLALAAKKHPTIGTIKSADPGAGTFIVTVSNKKKGPQDKDFTVTDTTTVTITNSDATTKDLKGKDGLKDPAVKEGASVKVTVDDAGAVTMVEVGGTYTKPKKPKGA
jgi:hypothetical protein